MQFDRPYDAFKSLVRKASIREAVVIKQSPLLPSGWNEALSERIALLKQGEREAHVNARNGAMAFNALLHRSFVDSPEARKSLWVISKCFAIHPAFRRVAEKKLIILQQGDAAA